MIDKLDGFEGNVLGYACKGQVTRQDYETVLVPAVEQALKQHDKLRLYYQIGPGFSGIDPGAMWEDFKVGMGHLTHWERIAVVTDVDWIRNAILAFGFLMPGSVKVFPLAEATQAKSWINATDG